MRNIFLVIIVLAFLAPVGRAFGQASAVMTFTNPNEALAYNELVRICKMAKDNAVSFSNGRYGSEKDAAVKNRLKEWRAVVGEEDILWVKTIAEMVLIKKKSPDDVYLNCMMKGKVLHPYNRRMINNILAGKVESD